MKKILLTCGAFAALGMAVLPATGQAAAYGNAGCGLGSIVFGDSPGIIQIFAATTNALFGSQTFGITSGTSNCGSTAQAAMMQETFVALNSSSLSRDVAAGNGEYLTTFSTLLGCEAGSQTEFATTMQSNHARIFTPDAKPVDVLTNVRTVISENETLVKVCKL